MITKDNVSVIIDQSIEIMENIQKLTGLHKIYLFILFSRIYKVHIICIDK
jgi:hypothetical protein